ncbi:MAG TPA: methyltransferase [Longimicrobium sp.]|nr:methyltransferase [Longimicrobium sp.]
MSSEAPTAADYFGSMAESYDSLVRRAIPRYDEMITRLVEYLPSRAERILELGCGTGNLTLGLCRRYPGAELVFVDASPEMVAFTRRRLSGQDGGFAERAVPWVARFEELDHRAGRFDLVVSSISMHHVREKQGLYRAVFALLEPGGTFRWSDQLAGATDEIHQRTWEGWLAFCRQPGNCTEQEIASLLEHARAHDHYEPLEEHFRMLGAAGFAPVDCTWRNSMWAVVTAERPPEPR